MVILHPPVSDGGAFILDQSALAKELTSVQVFRLTFDFFPYKFAACSKPQNKDNHRKASYPRTQQRDQGIG